MSGSLCPENIWIVVWYFLVKTMAWGGNHKACPIISVQLRCQTTSTATDQQVHTIIKSIISCTVDLHKQGVKGEYEYSSRAQQHWQESKSSTATERAAECREDKGLAKRMQWTAQREYKRSSDLRAPQGLTRRTGNS